MSKEKTGTFPRTYAEAIERGFGPVADISDAVKRITGLTMEQFKARKSHDLVGLVDCLNEPDGTACDSECSNGHCIIFYCHGGACSHSTALEGDL